MTIALISWAGTSLAVDPVSPWFLKWDGKKFSPAKAAITLSFAPSTVAVAVFQSVKK